MLLVGAIAAGMAITMGALGLLAWSPAGPSLPGWTPGGQGERRFATAIGLRRRARDHADRRRAALGRALSARRPPAHLVTRPLTPPLTSRVTSVSTRGSASPPGAAR